MINKPKAFIILGNQLFSTIHLKSFKDHHFMMAEDYQLCTYVKHHRQKILLFLSAMRSYADELKKANFSLTYFDCKHELFKKSYEDKILNFLNKIKTKHVSLFEVEDKFFETQLINFFKKNKIEYQFIKSPMFLSSRDDFKEYLQNNKKPFMGNFYKIQRIKFNILMKSKNEPLGGKWSFDEDNRNKLDPKVAVPKHIIFKQTNHTENIKKFLEKNFLDHPGEIESFNFPTTRKDTLNLYFDFLKNKLNLFGDFEDAISQKSHILFHSMLSPLINLGLLTPEQIVSETLAYAKTNKVKLNCLEGYLRQIIGWREFMRGIYQNYESKLENTNFFKHNKKLTNSWYDGTTGIDPLDHTIKNCIQYGWSHHIERLMVVANIMNLSGIEPKSVYRWFMEMYVDSSDWVMAPNVYGMGLFSDGGIFATKPYICASSYLLKMSDFKRGDWCDTLDGLYWQFIEKNKIFFGKNYRLSMMVKILEKMDKDKKKRIYSAADNFIKRNTN